MYDCILHAGAVSTPRREPTPVVYYLMVSPSIVKIGTTRDLVQRMCGLRTDLQYVVALELGSFDVERERHSQFAAERVGRKEDFQLSDRLKEHIEALVPHRDEVLRLATTKPARPHAKAEL